MDRANVCTSQHVAHVVLIFVGNEYGIQLCEKWLADFLYDLVFVNLITQIMQVLLLNVAWRSLLMVDWTCQNL